MTRIESKHVEIAKPAKEVYAYLIQLSNIEALLPSEKISNFLAEETKFSFKITGAIPVELMLINSEIDKLIQFKTSEKNSFQFSLDIHLEDKGDSCEAYQICNADINAFMKMMVEKPLAALFDYMVERLTKVMA